MGKTNRVFSGARPTGRQHLGNYLGAIQNYVALQDEFQCIYCIVDIHALTTLENTTVLQANVRDMALDWLAAGIDPRRSIVFVQSHVPEINELHALLSMVTPLSWLLRAPTFKEKIKMHPENVNYGLLGYPVLMASDITLYKADTVPVGEDQLPHLELTREIVRRFNSIFGETLVEPEARLTPFRRVMGLDGVQKMSKSLDNHIELALPAKEVEQKVRSMVTDPARVRRTDPGHPEVCNVFALHKFYTAAEQVSEIEEQCRTAGIGCVDCKKRFAANLNAALDPFRERRLALENDGDTVNEILRDGADRARVIARETLAQVKERMGLR